MAIISRLDEAVLLRRRRARETLRSVYRVYGCIVKSLDDYIVKEFDIPAECRRYRKPWQKEVAGLKRMGEGYAGAALGVVERVEEGTRKVFLVRRFIGGEELKSLGVGDIRGVARLLAEIHAKGIITDDANVGNFLRTSSGEFYFTDFGRSMVFPFRPAPAWAVGRELAKLYREGFGADREEIFDAFLCEYYAESHASGLRRFAINVCERTAILLRRLRKGREK
jgi:tRNA A-37 threonylcarbamoyl transferase component Bud32